jgi:hypothetical protein
MRKRGGSRPLEDTISRNNMDHPDEVDIDDYIASQSPEVRAAIEAEKDWAAEQLQRNGFNVCDIPKARS